MGQATISLSFQDGHLNEHSDILLSTDRAGWQNLLDLVLSEAYKARIPSQESQDAQIFPWPGRSDTLPEEY